LTGKGLAQTMLGGTGQWSTGSDKLSLEVNDGGYQGHLMFLLVALFLLAHLRGQTALRYRRESFHINF
jgi:hypothetical protein